MRFFLSLISALQLLRYANEGFLTGPPQIVQLTGKGIERQLARNNNVSIGIIGAGFAGLSAYQRLVWHGFSNVHLLEASSRIGGRVFPLEFEGSFLNQGAEFINGEGNPIFEIAERLGLIEGQVDDAAMISSNAVFASTPGCQVPPDRLLDKFANFTAELELHYAELAAAVPQLWNVTIAELFDQDFAQFLERENSTSQLVRAQYESLARMYRSYYEGEWSAPIEKLALRNYAQWKDGTQSFPFSSYTLDARGYAPILEELGRGIPEEKLHLNSRVVNIDYRGPHIQLRLQRRKGEEVGKHGQRMWTDLPDHFDFVIVTVSIGHLKRFAPALFTPPLPALKRKAIDAIGFGAMQKVFLIYDRPFWPANMSSLVTLSCPAGQKGNGGHELIRQSLHTLQPHPWASARVLVAWLSGDGPALINGLGDHELGTIVTGFLRDLFPQNKAIDEPDKIIRTKWLQDELFLGSYTYLTPEASHSPFWPDPFPLLAAPISGPEGQPRLLFAGEGTHSQMYQTTVGAFLSGQREADRVADHFALQAQQHNKCWAEN